MFSVDEFSDPSWDPCDLHSESFGILPSISFNSPEQSFWIEWEEDVEDMETHSEGETLKCDGKYSE